MNDYINLYISSCHVCQKVKNPKAKSWTPLGEIEASFPMDLVSIDLWSPGVTSRSGNKYVLTIIDGFSKFAYTVAIPNKEGNTIAQALMQFIAQFGIPNRIHSDLGKEFVNDTVIETLKKFGITKSNTTAYHPQGNAYAESLHKFFRQSITSYIEDDHRIWDELLPVLILCYNDSYHSALGCTPAEVFMGRRLNVGPLPTKGPVAEYTALGYALRLEYILAKTHALVFEKIQEKRERNSESMDSDNSPTSFEIGDEVMLYRPQALSGDSKKLSIHWYGPYKIHRRGIGEDRFSAFPQDLEQTLKDDDSSPNVLLEWNNPDESYVPTNILPSGDRRRY
jgi:transposase InsO family protein